MAEGLQTLLESVCIIMTIIILGYLARLSGYILPDAEKGIGAIAGRVALPALIASSVAKADIPAFVNEGGLKVVAVDCVCKGIVVMIAMAIAMCKASETPRLSVMGAYGVFVTNSNYMAVGVPLITAIFGQEKILYLIFFAMVQNIFINPILFGLILVGLAKAEQRTHDEEGDKDQHESRLRVLKQSMLRVASDPIVMAAVIGLVYNLCTMHSNTPMNTILKGVSEKLGGAFALCALFNLGMGIVGHLGSMASRSIIVPLILILLKSLALPMLEKGVGQMFLNQDQTEVLWVAGCISTAASTALIVSSFIPSLGGIFRGASVLNLLMSLPLLLLSQTLFKSNADTRNEITQYGRISGNILSMVGLVRLLMSFFAVKRWQRYPMWLVFDLVLIGLPFYVGHYVCHVIRELEPTPMISFHVLYFVTNVARLARRAYMLALSFVLLAQVRWHRWFPDTPYGYVEAATRSPQTLPRAEVQSAVECNTARSESCTAALAAAVSRGCYHEKMRKMHWAARIFAIVAGIAGTLPFMLFTPLHPLSGFSCWCAYGVPQWTWETISFIITTSLQGFALLSYLAVRSKPAWQHDGMKMFPGVKFSIATLLVLQFVALVMHLLLLAQILQIGQENFQVDPVWLQPLVVLILITDGGGFVLMFIFETSDVTWATYRRLCHRVWLRLVGASPVRNLEAYALKMATDPKLLDDYRADDVQPKEANCFSGCAAVDWLLEHGDGMSRMEARALCMQMMGRSLLVPSMNQPLVSFVDAEDYSYRIQPPCFREKIMKKLGGSSKSTHSASKKNGGPSPECQEDVEASKLRDIGAGDHGQDDGDQKEVSTGDDVDDFSEEDAGKWTTI